jgi:hypothetical protein
VQSAFVVHGEPYVDAALLPESPPPSDPEPPASPEPLELPDELPELLPLEPLDEELPELLDELPEELPVEPPLLLLDEEEPLLDPVDPLLAGVPGDVCPPELEFW